MIVKVQMSQHDSEKRERCLVYDKSRDFMWEGAPTEEIKKKMGSRTKAFYHLYSEGIGASAPELGSEATWQAW